MIQALKTFGGLTDHPGLDLEQQMQKYSYGVLLIIS
jgi:hypothetical protein